MKITLRDPALAELRRIAQARGISIDALVVEIIEADLFGPMRPMRQTDNDNDNDNRRTD